MSRTFLFVLSLLLIPIAVGATNPPTKAKQPKKLSRVWTIHLQYFDSGPCVWPESATNDDSNCKRLFPHLRLAQEDSVKFVVESGPDSCRVAFKGQSPLAQARDSTSVVSWIEVYRPGDPRNLYYVVAASTHPKGKWCRRYYNIYSARGDYIYTSRDTCTATDPGDLGHVTPCIRQIGPGMDTSD
jgi:hypothetical protein